jgi:enterochelin esterase-like enzyme
MNRFFVLLLLFGAASGAGQAQPLPQVSTGQIKRHENFASRFVTARHVDVWLPEGYDPAGKYAVLYMHDGQMLFDSSVTWNRQTWDVDAIAGRLIAERKIPPMIVVGVWNGGVTRHPDYFPRKPYTYLSKKDRKRILAAGRSNGAAVFGVPEIRSDQYLKFLVQELKPFIDSHYATYTDRAHTWIAGSSMGGLISMYAICEYPEVFGAAACLSTHWPGIFTMDNNPVPDAFFKYLKKHLPDPATHRLYFDYGTATLDALYPPLQAKADEILRKKGYTEANWSTRAFPGEDHSEVAWNRRLHLPLEFLLSR